ncbi:Thionin-like protein 2 [Raphanus sativus]|uniref:Thionin-like protein 2 n=1 Tax=Raphanus sativus TaxID=3726 RepID=A0A9W3CAA2_RAPSA|nr:thionin-like protein 2 [Raphanus sativus]KAJ4881701.1 Thionin-like protein 2 [Raphanus sativus]
MENKIMVILVVMMGSLLVETEAINFQECYKGCILLCGATADGFKKLACPFTCLKECTNPSKPDLQKIDQTDYFCKLGCATSRCVSSSSVEDMDHAEKVSVCVDSCSDMCSNKN